jgi:protocatechuate 3,4-dioxygenase beta subunit
MQLIACCADSFDGVASFALDATGLSRSGRFRFEGPRPRAYNGRPAHIHIKVEAPGFESLYTEYEPRGARRGNVRLVLFPSDL